MSNNELPTCHGKETFLTFAAAEKIMKRMRHRIDSGSRLGIYKCPICRNFHIGNKSREEQPIDRRMRKDGRSQIQKETGLSAL